MVRSCRLRWGLRDAAISELGPLYSSDHYRFCLSAVATVSDEDQLLTVRFWVRELLPIRVSAHKLVYLGSPANASFMGDRFNTLNADTVVGSVWFALKKM